MMYNINDIVYIDKRWRWSPTSLQCIKNYDGKPFTIRDYRIETSGVSYRKGYYYIIEAYDLESSYEIHEKELISISEIRNNKIEQICT